MISTNSTVASSSFKFVQLGKDGRDVGAEVASAFWKGWVQIKIVGKIHVLCLLLPTGMQDGID
jgi:hypothetical protein